MLPLSLGGNDDSSGEEGSGSPGQHSSSDPGSDLDELLSKDFPTEDLPSLISRAMGKGMLVECTLFILCFYTYTSPSLSLSLYPSHLSLQPADAAHRYK